MKPKYARADQLTDQEKKEKRSRRRFLLNTIKGAAAGAALALTARQAQAQQGWLLPPESSVD